MNLRSTLAVLLLLALTLLPLPARAQDSEDEEEESGFGHVFAEISTWIAQPAGLGYSPATRLDPSNAFGTDIVRPEFGTKDHMYTKVGYVMPGEMGTFMVSYFEHDQDGRLTEHNPGNFIYGETLAYPLFAGFNYDGLADFYEADFSTGLTDFRFDFIRSAIERPKVKADWFVGVRRVKHDRSQSARYAALIPDIPALLPPFGGPFPALDPLDDAASVSSSFSGRGLEAGMNFEIPLLRNRLTLDAGFAIGLIRGDVDAAYRSQTRYYVLEDQGEEFLLLPPFPEFEETEVDPMNPGNQIPLAGSISQRALAVGLSPNRISTSSDVIETHVGIRWNAGKDLSFSLGFRSSRYTDVGIDLKPTLVTGFNNFNLEQYTQVHRSATYEGVYMGLGYKY